MTSEAKIKPDLSQAVRECQESFRRVTALLGREHPEETDLGLLRSAWEKYYFHDFARFDRLLQAYTLSKGEGYEHLLPISISHHNLHRLFEVLRIEIGDQPLSTSRIPERILDLSEVFSRLTVLLEQAGNL